MMRFLKQLAYGVLYLAILAVIVFLVYIAFFRSASPIEVPESTVPETPKPNLVFENVETEVSGEEVKVTGFLKNESPQVVRNVEIKATLFSKEGIEIFSSETLEDNIGAFESESFTVFFPKDQGLAKDVWGESTELSYDILLQEF